MLTIRLQRMGKKNAPTYRLVIAEKGRDTQGRNLEILGTFNPRVKENGFMPNTERVKYWLEKGAQPSNTLHNLFLKSGLVSDEKKKKSVYISTKRAAKIAEKKKSAKPAVETAPAGATPAETAPAA
ncbi:MAG: 30S ribosomal protein S16 [Candidatus Magasanikbacteria bacterium]|nr:30S ribosomal protein S16 [Candidatus Magasanikbacteria bacterium]